MTWYWWYILGIVGGIILSFGLIISGTYIVMHSPKLQRRFMSRAVRSMMKGTTQQTETPSVRTPS
jgi:hypothetical protein